MKKLSHIIALLSIYVSALSQENGLTYRTTTLSKIKSGYININELTYAHGLGITSVPYSKHYYGLVTLHGYKYAVPGIYWKPAFIGGMAAGILFYDEGPLFPVQLEMRFLASQKKVAPWLNGSCGFLLNISDISGNSRYFLNAGGGLQFKLHNSLALTTGTGLLVQWYRDIPRDSFVNVRVGVAF